MNLTFPQLLAGSVGALLIYCAIVNKTPVVVLKEAFGQASTVSAERSGNLPRNTPTGSGTSGTGGTTFRI